MIRVKATDYAENVKLEPGPTTITWFDWALKGVAQDNRGVPITGLVPSLAPGSFGEKPSNTQGEFFIYSAVDAPVYTYASTFQGQSVLPPTSFERTRDELIRTILPPEDDLISNGGFESPEPLAGWETIGSTGASTFTVAQNNFHTGQSAAWLGGANLFAPAEFVDSLSFEYRDWYMMDAPDHTTHFVWASGEEIYYTSRDAAGIWISPTVIVSTTWIGGIRLLGAATDTKGDIHLFWTDGTDMGPTHYVWRNHVNGQWEDRIFTSRAFRAVLVKDHDGTLHLVLCGSSFTGGYIYSSKRLDGDWSQPLVVPGTPNESLSFQYEVAVTTDNTLHLLWIQDNHIITHLSRSSDGAWSLPHRIKDSSSQSSYLSVAADDHNQLYVGWAEDTRELEPFSLAPFVYMVRQASGEWKLPTRVPGMDLKFVYSGPVWRFDRLGTLHVLWATPTALCYVYQYPSGEWSTYQVLRRHVDLASFSDYDILFDDADRAYITWVVNQQAYYTQCNLNICGPVQTLRQNQDGVSDFKMKSLPDGSLNAGWADEHHIGYAYQAVVTQSITSTLSQQVTIPLTMTSPTLSLMYLLYGAAPDHGLDVLISQGLTNTATVTTTNVLSATSSGVWTHAWVDLSPWAGETITVTFALSESLGDPLPQVFVDDVTLGSAYPDLSVSATASSWAALPDDTVVLTFRALNRSSVEDSGVVLTTTLPVGLDWVSASITPQVSGRTLSWDVGALSDTSQPFTVVVTATVTADVQFGDLDIPVGVIGNLPELNRANNTVLAKLLISYLSYLPVVSKP